MQTLKQFDPDIYAAMREETRRQTVTLEIIDSVVTNGVKPCLKRKPNNQT
jgi:hypothetical protein